MWVTLWQVDVLFGSPLLVLGYSTSIRTNGHVNQLLHHPPTLVNWSKLKFFAIMLTQMAENLLMVEHFPISMHMAAFMLFANIAKDELTPKKILI